VSDQLHAPAALPPAIHWIGGWVSLKTGLKDVKRRKINRLLLFGETVAVYCENHMKHTNTLVGRMQSFGVLKQVVHIITSGL
jgi:hypothetical protein